MVGALGRVLCVTKDAYVPVDSEPNMNMRRLEDLSAGPDLDGSGHDDRSKIMADTRRQNIVSEWRRLAAIIDRLLFLIYIVLLLFITISILR